MLWTNLEEFRKSTDPWEELERVRRAFSMAMAPSNGEFPAVNIWSSGDKAIVTTEVPGIEPEAIDISVAGKTLTLKGTRQPEELKEEESYHRKERWYGQFTKAIDLPFNVEADKVKARFSRGVLHIDLPRAEAEKPRRIEIKAEQEVKK